MGEHNQQWVGAGGGMGGVSGHHAGHGKPGGQRQGQWRNAEQLQAEQPDKRRNQMAEDHIFRLRQGAVGQPEHQHGGCAKRRHQGHKVQRRTTHQAQN